MGADGVLVPVDLAARCPGNDGSYSAHAGCNTTRLQQPANISRIAGEHQVARARQERHMRIDDIGRAGLLQQLAYLLAVASGQGFDANARQDARKIGLLAAITPYLAHDRRAGSERHRLQLKHAQLGTYRAITTANCD